MGVLTRVLSYLLIADSYAANKTLFSGDLMHSFKVLLVYSITNTNISAYYFLTLFFYKKNGNFFIK